MPAVFVTDAQMRSSLAVIRSLGKKGLKVTAGEETYFATGFFSKYCNSRVVYPSPKKKRDEFVDCLFKCIKKHDYDVLFPVADACLDPIMEYEEEILNYTKIALPPKEVFFKGYDKGITLKIAIENGIPCPKTYYVSNQNDLYNIADKLEYPAVIKPRISSGRRGVRICSSYLDLIDKYKQAQKKYDSLLIQEFIPSSGEFGVYTLFDHSSEPVALTVQRRLRSYPVSGGPSTLRETFRDETSEKAVAIAFKLLRAMKWVGVAMVEFRIDARDGIPKLMEINPRFWGSLQLSILAGVDFPYLLYNMMMDKHIDPVLDYNNGIKCRWLLPGDILWFLSAPNKLRNLPEFLKFDVPDDIISIEDPMPTIGFALATARYLFDKDMWRFVLRR